MGSVNGDLTLLSDSISNGFTNYFYVPAMKIGGHTLKSTITHAELYSLLVMGNSYKLSLGRFFFWHWLVRLESDGEVHRFPTIFFLIANGIHSWIGANMITAVAGIFFPSRGLLELIATLVGIVLFALNFKAWLK